MSCQFQVYSTVIQIYIYVKTYIYMSVYILFQILFPYRLLQNIDYIVPCAIQ